MRIPPVAIGIGAGAVVATGVAIGTSKMADAIMQRHPTGSSGDTPVALSLVGVGAAGLAVGVAGGFAAATKFPKAGIAAVVLGAGTVLGSAIGGIASSARHGRGVETVADGIVNTYDRNWDDELNLEGSYWSPPETFRKSVQTQDRNDDGDTWDIGERTETIYEITRFAEAADVDGDRVVTKGEARDLASSFDADGNGRLKGAELRSFRQEYGERTVSAYSRGWNDYNY